MPPRRRKSQSYGPVVQDYIDGSTATDYRSDGTAQSSNRSIKQQVTHAAKGMFLPEGYPNSVAPDYLPFQTWDTLQGLCSYIRGLLTAQAVLKGVGVGQQAATPLAAVFLFFLRDLAGMLGGILFAFWQGSSFDTCAKQWRLFADVTNDVGMAAELASPFFPGAFLAMACFGSVARAVTGVAGGATRAALTMHFALRGNAADVSAKESSQETATTLFGMVLGMAFTKVTADHAASAWTLFVLLTVVHIWANVRALRCLVLCTVNIPRLELLVKHYLQHGHVPGPTEIASLESLVPPPLRPLLLWLRPWAWRRPRPMPIQFGVTLSEAAQETRCGTKELCDAIVHAGTVGQEHVLLCSRRRILVALHKDFIAPADLLRAYVHAQVLAVATQDRHTRAALGPLKRSHSQSAPHRQRSWPVGPAPAPGEDPLTWSHVWMTHHCATFLHKCESQGWDLGNTQLKAPRYLISYPVEHTQQQQEVAAATKRFREGKHVVIGVS